MHQKVFEASCESNAIPLVVAPVVFVTAKLAIALICKQLSKGLSEPTYIEIVVTENGVENNANATFASNHFIWYENTAFAAHPPSRNPLPHPSLPSPGPSSRLAQPQTPLATSCVVKMLSRPHVS